MLVDDAFDVDAFVLEDLPLNAYYELAQIGGATGLEGAAGAPIWWPLDLYRRVQDHPFWQGKFPREYVPIDGKKKKPSKKSGVVASEPEYPKPFYVPRPRSPYVERPDSLLYPRGDKPLDIRKLQVPTAESTPYPNPENVRVWNDDEMILEMLLTLDDED